MGIVTQDLERLARLLKEGKLTEDEYELLREETLSEHTNAEVTQAGERLSVSKTKRPIKYLAIFLAGLMAFMAGGAACFVTLQFRADTNEQFSLQQHISELEGLLEKNDLPMARSKSQALLVSHPEKKMVKELAEKVRRALSHSASSVFASAFAVESESPEASERQYREALKYANHGEAYHDEIVAGLIRTGENKVRAERLTAATLINEGAKAPLPPKTAKELLEELSECEGKRAGDLAKASCLSRVRIQLNRHAKENYVRGYILEQLGRIPEAITYWKKALEYSREGDDYHLKILAKLKDHSQK